MGVVNNEQWLCCELSAPHNFEASTLYFHSNLALEIKSQNLHTVSCVWVHKDLVNEESVTFGSQPR